MNCLVPRRTAGSLALCFFLLFCVGAVSGDAPSERAALLELKRGVSDRSGVLSSWGVAGLSHCLWIGVSCDSDSRVVSLRISGERGNTEALSSSLFSLDGEPRVRSFDGRGKLEGKISPLVGRLTELRVLSLPHNNLVGEIPEQIWGLEKLEVLHLEGNKLTGEVPGLFTGLRRLRVLNLGFNRISGAIPAGLSECVDLKFLNLAGNMLYGTIPGYLGALRKLRGLDLSRNKLTGDVPPGIVSSCEKLEHLDLSGNTLVGGIPDGLANCRQLRKLVLHSIWSLESTDTSNLHRKIMSGHHIPRLPFTLRFSQHRAGRALTSLAVQVKDQEVASLTTENDSDEEGGLNSIEVASIASASAIVVVLLALIILFIYTRKWVPDSRVQGLELREITVFSSVGAPLTFESIIRATGNFNAGKCIGNGGFGATYKAEIHPGITVAVKRLSVGRCQGDQQFHAEIETLGRIRHANLVTLVGYHASEVEMFLIYNFLPGGNLENFIKEKSPKSTEWKTLHKIAIDIAHALAYLHDTCVPRVLHRDVKPSNILLDNNLNAYLSDFGLSRLMGTSETHATTSVAGTFGYLAPEYAMTCRVSDKSDVYSYGVVLLELISDKRPLDPSFSSHGDGFNIVTWATMLLKQGRAKEVFTAGLWEAGPHDDLVDMLHVAVVCTNETLSVRPTMKHVVQRLKRIKPLSLGS